MSERRWTVIGLLCLGMIPASCGCGGRLCAEPETPSGPNVAERRVQRIPRDEATFRVVGSQRCAAEGCHGAAISDHRSAWRSSFSVWIRDDAHRRAYQVLFDQRARRIVGLLEPKLKSALDAPYREFLNERCVGCHATSADNKDSSALGVGCESCHGAAERWVDAHTRKSWTGLTTTQKSELGFVDATRLTSRAGVCVDCHVGSASSDATNPQLLEVSHDLIAAGHPAMRFDFAAYLEALPRHWPVESMRGTAIDHWTAGKLMSTAASLRLLRGRLIQSNRDSANWPEFAEYDCFDCHHGLKTPVRRKTPNADEIAADSPRQRAGSPHWGAWTTSMAPRLGLPKEEVRQVVGEMSKRNPNVLLALGRVEPLQRSLQRLIEEFEPVGETGIEDLRRLAEQDVKDLLTWDCAAQWSLAFRAALDSLPEGSVPERRRRQLRELHKELLEDILRFSNGYDSPVTYDPADYLRARRKLTELLQ